MAAKTNADRIVAVLEKEPGGLYRGAIPLYTGLTESQARDALVKLKASGRVTVNEWGTVQLVAEADELVEGARVQGKLGGRTVRGELVTRWQESNGPRAQVREDGTGLLREFRVADLELVREHFVVEMTHEGSDWLVRRATAEEVADPDEETLPLEEAEQLARQSAANMGCRYYVDAT